MTEEDGALLSDVMQRTRLYDAGDAIMASGSSAVSDGVGGFTGGCASASSLDTNYGPGEGRDSGFGRGTFAGCGLDVDGGGVFGDERTGGASFAGSPVGALGDTSRRTRAEMDRVFHDAEGTIAQAMQLMSPEGEYTRSQPLRGL
jgi:hypothetical protein